MRRLQTCGIGIALCGLITLVAACGDEEEPAPASPVEDVGADVVEEDTGGDGQSDAAEDVPDAEADVPGEEVGEDVEPWWRDDVDHTLRPGEVVFPAVGSISEPAGAGSFQFGVATAATQIEDQNSAVDWWFWSSPAPEGLGKGTPLGEASRGFSMAMADVELLAELGVDAYRFSVEWARVEPRRDEIDEEALAHYEAFIDALVARGIRPVLTVHHFSNPVWIDDPRDPTCADGPSDANLCGWNHAEGGPMVVEEIAEFGRLLGERFGDRVDVWCTVNEPINYLFAAYGAGAFPPGKQGIFDIERIFIPAVRNYIAAHAALYDAIKEADTVDVDGDGEPASVGFTQAVARWAPARDNLRSNRADDIAGVHRMEYFYHYLFVDAILQGGFDPDVDMVFDEPHPEWAGRLDWLGVQYYFRAGVTTRTQLLPAIAATPCAEGIDFGACLGAEEPSHWIEAMEYEWWEPGLYEILVDFAARWPALPMTVTESGVATRTGRRRAEHVVRSLEQIWRAVEGGADVRGYYHWSLYDNFEWARGYGPRFGLYTVDYEGDYARAATEGATLYSRITADRKLTEDVRADYGGLGPLTAE